MSDKTNEVVSAPNEDRANSFLYLFDNNEVAFTLDHERIAREGLGIVGDYKADFLSAMIGTDCKTLIHRTSSRPKGNGEDATDWFLEALSGGAQAGRFRVTTDDKERAATAMKGYTMAPEQTEKQFLDKYGVPFQNDAAWLAKHYMGVRAAMAAAAKAAKSMI